MAIKGGQILHVAGSSGATFVIDRIQSGGVTGINVNETRIEELGNYETVGTVRDIPDITFELESYDVTTEIESILTGGDNTEANGAIFLPTNSVPLDIISPFKGQGGVFTVAMGVAIPFLALESLSYSMSLTDPATVTATLRGDSVFYTGGGLTIEQFSGDSVTTAFNFTDGPAYLSTISGDSYYALSVMVDNGSGWERQRLGTDFTNTASGVTFTTAPTTGTDNIQVVYAHGTAQSYLQTVHDTTKPAAVRGADISVSLGGTNWVGVQSASVDWSVTLDRDEEFGNPQVVAQDYDTPEVSGTVSMKPADATDFYAQIQAAAGISTTDVANATQDPPELDLRILLTDPSDGSTLKTLQVEKAKFTMPAVQGQVGNKLEVDFPFTSSDGVLKIHKADIV